MQFLTGTLDPHLFLRHPGPCSSKLSCDLQAFTVNLFTVPVLLSLGSVVLVVVVTQLLRASRGRRDPTDTTSPSRLPPPVAGWLFTAVALVAYQLTGHLVTGLAAAIVVLAAGGAVADLTRAPLLARMALAAPGGYLIASHAALPDPVWAREFAGAVTIVGAGMFADLDRRLAGRGLGPLLLAVTTLGLYESVPDPDFALLLFGAALPIALLGWPVPLARLGGAGAASAAGFIAWAGAVGGRGMTSAIVAGGACFGIIAIEPIAHLLQPRRATILERLPEGRMWPLLVALAQLGIVAACTRLTAKGRSPLESGKVAAVALVGGIAVACALSRRRATGPSPPPAPATGRVPAPAINKEPR